MIRGLVFLFVVLVPAVSSQAEKLSTANVMAPLQVKDGDFVSFQQQLLAAKALGVDAVSTDVWWGLVESQRDQQFDWSYYDRISDAIIQAGLKWVPIVSVHACGNGPGDSVNIPLPAWLWTRLHGLSSDDLKYTSEEGNVSSEAVSLWADDHVISQYRELMEAFEDHFAQKAQHIIEINISCGPTGELRYPSYANGKDKLGVYPERGALQCYGRLAKEDFRRFALRKYGSLVAMNKAWGSQLQDETQIDVPSNFQDFFGKKDYLLHPYGKDLTAWLNGSLINHGERMIRVAMDTFRHSMKSVDIGVKIPGVHWRIGDPNMPRVAEVTAGLIPTNIDVNADETAHGYQPLISMIGAFRGAPHRIVLHFTCLEMPNDNHAKQFSCAESLVFWISAGAAARGLTLKGENALAEGVNSEEGWNRIENVFRWSHYSGFTVLRIGDVTDNEIGHRRYEGLIKSFHR